MRVLGALSLFAVVLTLGCDESDGPTGFATPARPHASRVLTQASRTMPGRAERRLPAQEFTWEMKSARLGTMHVIVSVPEREPEARLPVLVALHGRGEALKGSARGARAWLDDYQLPRALERLGAPPLTAQDFGGEVDPKRLAQLNRHLGAEPYAGLIVVCPYTPDILAGARAFAAAEPLAAFVVDELLPRVFDETPAIGTRETTGIDGVSLGGRAALLVGFARPEAFGVVGSLQAAIDREEIPRLVELGRSARAVNPRLTIRLLTSEQDYFRVEVEQLSAALKARSLGHVFTEVLGDHSYEFNRGPGVYEMLTFHNWALREGDRSSPEPQR